MSDDTADVVWTVISYIAIMIIGFALVCAATLRGNSYGKARCESMGGEYSYAADVCFKDGEEV